MKELFYRFNPWWEGDFKPNFIDRKELLTKLSGSLDKKNITILTGLRRVGKTTLLKMLINSLIKEKGVEPKYIFYISLDFYSLEKQTILEIVEQYLKIQKISFDDKIFLFLDEVATKSDFSLQLKNIFDLYNAKIYASSSSASVLKDSKANLTGREEIIEVLPLTFEEFLNFKNIKIKQADSHLEEAYFEKYMEIGGIPEYVLTNDINYIKQLVDDILYKDIIAYYNIKEKNIVRDFFALLMERAGKQVSINKLAKILGISPDTAKRFLNYFKDTYLIYTIDRYGKLNDKIKSPKKIYAGDVGIRNVFTGFRDKGAVFENLIFLKIKHKNPNYIYENGLEIDFITDDKKIIEVKYNTSMNEKQKKLFDSLKGSKKFVITNYEEMKKILNDIDV